MVKRTQLFVLVGVVLGVMITGVALAALTGTSPVEDGVTLSAPDGVNGTINGDTDVQLEDFTDGSDTVVMNTTDGNVTFQAAGPANGTIHKDNITSTYSTVSRINTDSNDLTVDPEGKQDITIGKQIDFVSWRDNIAIDDGTVDFEYDASGTAKVVIDTNQANTQIGAIDTANNAFAGATTTDGSGTATFDNLKSASGADIQLQTGDGPPSLSNLKDDGSTRDENQTLTVDVSDPDLPNDNVTLEWKVDGTTQNTTYATSNGTYSAIVGPLSDGTYDYSVEATDAYGESDTTNQQSFTIDHYDPEIRSISPTGDLDVKPNNIEVQFNDSDFGSNQDGDELSYTIDLDGSQIDSGTLQDNSTVSVSIPNSGQTGGDHTIAVSVTDDYSQTTTDSAIYSVPDDLYIRNELNHSELVPANGEVRFFASGSVTTKTAPNGIVNLTGLPVNERMIVEAEPTDDNFTQRTIILENIYAQEDVYVLNESNTTTITSRFELEDSTGRFTSEDRLQIQKPINVSGNVQYQTIVADEFGVEGVEATLESGQRYELVINGERDTQEVGPYRSTIGETVQVSPGNAEVPLNNTLTSPYSYGAAIDNTTIEYRYSDPEQQTGELKVYIHERYNKSNQPVANTTYTDLGNVSAQKTIPADQRDNEFVVEFIVTRNNEEETATVTLSNRKSLLPAISDRLGAMIAVMILVLLAGAFSVLNASIGAVIVSLTGGLLWFVGFLDGATSGAAIAMALFISVIGHIYSKA